MPLKQYLIDNECTMYLCKSYFLSRHYMYLACYLNLTWVLHDCYHFCVCENLIRLAGVVVALRLHNFWQKASHGRVPRMERHIHMVSYGQKMMKSSLCGHSMTFQGNFNPEKKSSGFINPGVTLLTFPASVAQFVFSNGHSIHGLQGNPPCGAAFEGIFHALAPPDAPQGPGPWSWDVPCGDDGKSGLRPWKIPTIPIYPIILYKIPSFTLG